MSLKLYSSTIGGGGSVSFPVTIGQGGTGQTTQTLAFNALSPQTTKGDIIAFDGTNSVRFAQGTSGQILSYDPTTSTGLKAIDPPAGVALPVTIANGGSGCSTAIKGFDALSPLTTKGDLITSDATDNIRFAAGASGTLLSYDPSTGSGLRAVAPLALPVAIASGGTGQTTKTDAFDALSPMTTLGDIIYYDGTDGVRKASFSETDDGNSGTSKTIDFSGYKLSHKLTLTGSPTLTFTAPDQVGSALTLRVLTGAGSFNITWPGTVKWVGSVAPVVTVTASKVDMFIFYWDGTSYYGSFNQNY